MSIEQINQVLCNGCGICVNSCPMDVIRLDKPSKKAVIQYKEECMLCGQCRRFCPQNAITISKEKFQPLMVCWT